MMENRVQIGRLLILCGLFLVTAGIIFLFGGRIPIDLLGRFGKLPGDLSWTNKTGSFRIFFPFTSSILISLLVTLILWFIRKR